MAWWHPEQRSPESLPWLTEQSLICPSSHTTPHHGPSAPRPSPRHSFPPSPPASSLSGTRQHIPVLCLLWFPPPTCTLGMSPDIHTSHSLASFHSLLSWHIFREPFSRDPRRPASPFPHHSWSSPCSAFCRAIIIPLGDTIPHGKMCNLRAGSAWSVCYPVPSDNGWDTEGIQNIPAGLRGTEPMPFNLVWRKKT